MFITRQTRIDDLGVVLLSATLFFKIDVQKGWDEYLSLFCLFVKLFLKMHLLEKYIREARTKRGKGEIVPVVHFDKGGFFLMPISGRHTLCLCGKSFQDNYTPNDKRKTTDKEKVSCKNCLKKLSQEPKK